MKWNAASTFSSRNIVHSVCVFQESDVSKEEIGRLISDKQKFTVLRCTQMRILKTIGSEVPKIFVSKPNVLGLALHQWHINDFQIKRDNNRCVRENV